MRLTTQADNKIVTNRVGLTPQCADKSLALVKRKAELNLLQSRASVARLAHNQEAIGSIPISAPNLRPHRITVSTTPFHGVDRSSILRGGTIYVPFV